MVLLSANKVCLALLSLLFLSACVSRYDPVDKIHPLSSDCVDYAAFAKGLAKHRDNGFTKRATMSMAGYSVNNTQDRKILYKRYQVILDIIYADLMIDPESAKLMGKIICEQRQQRIWQPLNKRDVPAVASMVRQCRKDNFAMVDMENCIVDRLKEYWRNDLAAPPGYNSF